MDSKILTLKSEMLPMLPLIQQLSPSVTAENYAIMLEEMIAKDYKMLAIFDGETCVGLSGFWIATKFYSGKYLEMDNVVVAEDHRNKGIGKILCDVLLDLAIKEGVKTIMLDAYLENHKAHAFYEREGFEKRGYHILKRLS
jgi:ribosomal protein S18 acetylase RimI-like enzyme